MLQNLEGRNARFRYLFARLRNTAYAVVDQIAEEMRCSDFVPLAFELSFGERGELPAVTVSEPDAEAVKHLDDLELGAPREVELKGLPGSHRLYPVVSAEQRALEPAGHDG